MPIITWNTFRTVNTTTDSQQAEPSVSATADGGYIVAWMSRTDSTAPDVYPDSADDAWFHGSDIYAQFFNAAGIPVRQELIIEGEDARWDNSPAIKALSNGNFAVGWNNEGSGGSDTYTTQLRFFDANGAPIDDKITLGGGSGEPSLTELTDGRLVATWTGYNGGYTLGINAQIFNPDGTSSGGAFKVSQWTDIYGHDHAEASQVTPLDNGNFVVTYQFSNADHEQDPGRSIWARVIKSDGTPVGSEFMVNTLTDGDQTDPQITGLNNGSFVITWTGSGDGSDAAVRGQVFEADGTPVNDEFNVNTTAAGWQGASTVTALKSGGFLVAWQNASSGTAAQKFNNAGVKVGPETVLQDRSAQPGYRDANLAELDDGRVVLVSTDSGIFSPTDVYAQIVDPRGATIEGTKAHDVIFGNSLNNTLKGLGGNDRLLGQGGNDRIVGGTGNDKLLGAAGSDVLLGGNGRDTLRGGTQNDTLRGGGGVDKLLGEKGADKMYGDAGKDTLIGGAGKDVLFGGGHADTLKGGSGNDILRGGAGNDRIETGAGRDVAFGGTGSDTFVFGGDRDRIGDFANDIDSIVLNDSFWSGTLTKRQVLNQFGEIKSGNAVLDFGDGDKLVVEDVTTLSQLIDDIVIV